MRKLLCFLSMSLFIINEALTNGVAIVDANNGVYLTLISSKVETIVENQVSITRTTQLFRNDFTSDHIVKYSFPLPGKASATALRYRINDGDWISAIISPTPQDTTLPGPGGEIDENLKFYLGETPVFFAIPDTTKPEALLKVELSYVELLHLKLSLRKKMENYLPLPVKLLHYLHQIESRKGCLLITSSTFLLSEIRSLMVILT